MQPTLVITEIYASVQGESSFAGIPCTFVRTTGCPLRCRWCDTVYSFEGGKSLSLEDIVAEVERLGMPIVELTGGEPLAQSATAELARTLAQRGHKVLIETGGSESVANVVDHAHLIVDVKCPGSGMAERNRWENIEIMKPSDELKFVLANREDFDWAVDRIREYRLDERFQVLLSCAFGLLSPKDLAAWMVEEKLSCRLNLQQHKYIWHPRAKGV